MRKDTVESILLLIAIMAPLSAFVVFWVGKLLNLRKEIIELQMNRQFDRQEINELKQEVKDLWELWNRGRNN